MVSGSCVVDIDRVVRDIFGFESEPYTFGIRVPSVSFKEQYGVLYSGGVSVCGRSSLLPGRTRFGSRLIVIKITMFTGMW